MVYELEYIEHGRTVSEAYMTKSACLHIANLLNLWYYTIREVQVYA